MATALVAEPSARPADGVKLYLGLKYDLLMYAFVRWRAEDLFPLIFHNRPDMTLDEFLDWNYQPTVEPVGCFLGEHLIGIGWVCQAYQLDQGVVAEVGAAFFKDTPTWAWKSALDQFLRHAFEDRGFAEIYGLSLEYSPAAYALLRYCGMHRVTYLPWAQTVSADTMVFALDRRSWEMNRRLKELQ